VNLLHERAQLAAELFSTTGAERFDSVEWGLDEWRSGPHLTAHSHCIADCRLAGHTEVGDHAVVFGEVERVTQRAGMRPLIYGLRQYSSWPGELAEA